MFYYKKGLTRRVRVHPKYIGGKHDIIQIARKIAKQDIKDSPFSPEYGYVVKLIQISHIGDGQCIPLVGYIEFPITFEAVVFYPIVGEVVYAEVVKVTESCIIFRHACIYGVVRDYCLDDQDFFSYEERPLIYKGSKCLPVKEGLYRSKINLSKTIEKDTVIRIRIMKRTLGGNGFFLIGSMFGETLGVVDDPPPVPQFGPSHPQMITAVDESDSSKSDTDDDGILAHTDLQKLWEKRPYHSKPKDLDCESVLAESNSISFGKPLSLDP